MLPLRLYEATEAARTAVNQGPPPEFLSSYEGNTLRLVSHTILSLGVGFAT
jgi:hypothetical protein